MTGHSPLRPYLITPDDKLRSVQKEGGEPSRVFESSMQKCDTPIDLEVQADSVWLMCEVEEGYQVLRTSDESAQAFEPVGPAVALRS